MVERLGENVVVIGEGGSANSTLIGGRGCTILVDTTLFPEKALKISKFAKELFGSSIGVVVNTHYHPDHTFGNSVFEDKEIVSSSLTKRFMEEMDIEYIKAVWGEERAKREHITIPSITFDSEKTFQFCGYKVLLKRVGGHTPDSSIVYVEELGLVVVGDLLFNGYHPEITADSDLGEWIRALTFIRELQPRYIIPGHGGIGDIGDVKLMKEYLLKFLGMVEGRVKEEEILRDPNFVERDFPELFSYSLENFAIRNPR